MGAVLFNVLVDDLDEKIFKMQLDKELDNLIKALFSHERLNLVILQDPFQPGLFCGTMVLICDTNRISL